MSKQKILVTGGAGFVGSNLVNRLVEQGNEVTIFDNLSRKGTEKNVAWLQEKFGTKVQVIQGDVRNFSQVNDAVKGKEVIFHLAAQVAVTTSVANPREDFEINALGTLNVLEAARLNGSNPIIVFTSTNKVYGGLEDIVVIEQPKRYSFKDYPSGISESRGLDFHSPYGCSKGAADQYIRDYSRIFGLRTVVFRMSCIYGPRQFGNEDQGWVAHFIISAVFDRPITIYGDGKQVRDILYVDDLVNAFQLAVDKIETTAGQIYNLGGGKNNTVSAWLEFREYLTELLVREIPVRFSAWRPGDQKVYISDIRKAGYDLGWHPQIKVKEGIERLYQWVIQNSHLF
ncbi:MAG: SDR family NAD(P)-dependent oxidoreductase [bacterium]|nr:SDR family NAD(P)-dependent oxidoreductase [bacterium]